MYIPYPKLLKVSWSRSYNTETNKDTDAWSVDGFVLYICFSYNVKQFVCLPSQIQNVFLMSEHKWKKSQNLLCIRSLRHFVNKTTQTSLFYSRFFIDLRYLRCYRKQCILLSAILHQSKNRSCFNIRWRGVYPISPMMETEQNRYKKSPQIKIKRGCDPILDHLILFTYLLMVFFISRGRT